MKAWIILIACSLLAAVDPPGVPVTGPSIAGQVRIVKDFPSAILHNERSLIVYLPPHYGDTAARYPVLYVQDGQNIFDSRTSFSHQEWGLDETAERLIAAHQITPLIMVGIYNNDQRMAEYTQVSDPHHPGGQADAYDQFLIRELKPWVDRHYRTQPDASHTGILGSSLGGLLALYSSWKHPDVFGLVGAVSPSLWWADQELTRAMAAEPARRTPSRVWLDIGTQEGDEPVENVENTRRMHAVLQSEGLQDEVTLFYREIPGGIHHETAWAARAGDILTHLFPPPGDQATPDLPRRI